MNKITKILVGNNFHEMKKVFFTLAIVGIFSGWGIQVYALSISEMLVEYVPLRSKARDIGNLNEAENRRLTDLSNQIFDLLPKWNGNTKINSDNTIVFFMDDGTSQMYSVPQSTATPNTSETQSTSATAPSAPVSGTTKTDTQAPFGGTAPSGQQNFGGKATPSSAQPISASFDNPLGGVDSLADLFYRIINFIIGLSYVVIAAFYLIAGFKFVKAQGNPEELSGAKRAFMNTTIGAIIIIGINVITQVIQSIIEGLQS